MRRTLPALAAALVFGFVLGLLWPSDTPESETENDQAEAAARHLTAIMRSNGTFEYEINLITGLASKDDSGVRQAGTGFALAEYYAHSQASFLEEPLRTFIDGIWERSIPAEDGALVSEDGEAEGAKTGATALALLALLFFEQGSTSDEYADRRLAWLNGLRSLWRPDAGFRRSPVSDSESPYYNGETWLALAVAADMYPDLIDSDRLNNLDEYLMRTYGPELDKGFFHWGVMASSQRFKTTGERRFIDFAADQTERYLALVPDIVPRFNSCYVVEGLAALAGVLGIEPWPGDRELRNRVLARIDAEMRKNLSFQVTGDRIDAGFADIRSDALSRYPGAFRNGLYRFNARIDFTQHCLSALVKQDQIP